MCKQPRPFLPKLTTLTCDNGLRHWDVDSFFYFFIRARYKVTKLVLLLDPIHSSIQQIVLSVFAHCSEPADAVNSTLKDLTCSFPHTDIAKDIFSRLKALESIKFLCTISQATLMNVAFHCRTLKKICLTACITNPAFDETEPDNRSIMRRFLAACKNLEELELNQLCCLDGHVH